MKKYIVIMTVLLSACTAWPKYEGYATEEGEAKLSRIYDYSGRYVGMVDRTGRVYDKDGRFIGMIRDRKE